jgi:hypothetical protein
LPTALLFAAHGADVVGVDVKQSVVDCLNHGNLPFSEPGLEDLYRDAKERFCARTEPEAADVFLIAVPTPLDPATKVSDLKYVKKAADMIATHLGRGNLVVLESTVPPGTSERVVIPRLEKSGVVAGDFLYAHCPERAIPGRTLQEMAGNSRIVGGYDRDSTDRATSIRSGRWGTLHRHRPLVPDRELNTVQDGLYSAGSQRFHAELRAARRPRPACRRQKSDDQHLRCRLQRQCRRHPGEPGVQIHPAR